MSAIWHRLCSRHALFNGRTFCATSTTPGHVRGYWSEYRRAAAQSENPALFRQIRHRGLAVCGLLFCPDGLLLGRREPNSVYQPGIWQCPPAGSVDIGAAVPGGADWRRSLLAELEEELGLGTADVRDMTPLCLVQHPSGVLDLGIRMWTPLGAAELGARHARSGNGEYDRLLVVPPGQVDEVVAAQGGTLSESTRRMVAMLHAGPDPAGMGGDGIEPPTLSV